MVTAYELPTYWMMPAGQSPGVTREEIAESAFIETQALVDQMVAPCTVTVVREPAAAR